MRTIREFNNFWKFTKLQDEIGISKKAVISPEYADTSWQFVVLPHTYNSEDGAGRTMDMSENRGDYYHGSVCYRRSLVLSSEECEGKEVYLEFEGANTVAEVYINGRFVGKHSGGYSAFRFNLTDYICADKDNLIAVIVSNAPTNYIAPIADQGDFTKMGGLYRGVKLIIVDPVHIALNDSGSCGVYIMPHNISESAANINMLVKLDKAEIAEAKAKIYDPQGVLIQPNVSDTSIRSKVNDHLGHHTFFVRMKQGQMEWWQPVNVQITKSEKTSVILPFSQVNTSECRVMNMDSLFNANVTDIFRNEYLTPRSPYTTLQLPVQGIGEWCHPKLTADIDDAGLRALVRDEMLTTKLGVPFRTLAQGSNIAFTSLWDNYPDSLSIPLSGRASHAYLMMAGSTNHMQCRIANGIVRVYYTDGTSDVLELVNPDNWCPIEQDFYVDGQAFTVVSPRPYRIHFKTGLVSNDLGKDLGIKGVYGRSIEGGAGVLLDMPLNPSKELSHLTLETLSNDVVIGLMGVTLQ